MKPALGPCSQRFVGGLPPPPCALIHIFPHVQAVTPHLPSHQACTDSSQPSVTSWGLSPAFCPLAPTERVFNRRCWEAVAQGHFFIFFLFFFFPSLRKISSKEDLSFSLPTDNDLELPSEGVANWGPRCSAYHCRKVKCLWCSIESRAHLQISGFWREVLVTNSIFLTCHKPSLFYQLPQFFAYPVASMCWWIWASFLPPLLSESENFQYLESWLRTALFSLWKLHFAVFLP